MNTIKKFNRIFHFPFIYFVWVAFLSPGCDNNDEAHEERRPVISKVTPPQGFSGMTVRISGSGFSTDAAMNIVAFNGSVAEVKAVAADTLLEVIVPDDVVTGPVIVAHASSYTEGPIFTVVDNAKPPMLAALSVSQAEIGEIITVKGTNFDAQHPAFNLVTIGKVAASTNRVTATEIDVVVPVEARGAAREVQVSVRGAKSNTLPLDIMGFGGKLYWYVNPYNNRQDAFPQYVYAANADGSFEKSVVALPEDTDEGGNFLQYAVAPYNPSSGISNSFPTYMDNSGNLYMANTDRSQIIRVRKGWQQADFTTLYTDAMGIPLSSSKGIAAHGSDENSIFVTVIDPNTYVPAVAKAGKDGSSLSLFATGSFTNPIALASSKRYLYVIDEMDINTRNTKLKRILLEGDGTVEEVDLSPMPVPSYEFYYGIKTMAYSAADDALYFVYGVVENNWYRGYLGKIDEHTGAITIVNDRLPGLEGISIEDLQVKDTPTGTKLYYLTGRNQNIFTVPPAIYLINLRSARPIPIRLYKDLASHPENGSVVKPGNGYVVSRFFLDNE